MYFRVGGVFKSGSLHCREHGTLVSLAVGLECAFSSSQQPSKHPTDPKP